MSSAVFALLLFKELHIEWLLENQGTGISNGPFDSLLERKSL